MKGCRRGHIEAFPGCSATCFPAFGLGELCPKTSMAALVDVRDAMDAQDLVLVRRSELSEVAAILSGWPDADNASRVLNVLRRLAYEGSHLQIPRIKEKPHA